MPGRAPLTFGFRPLKVYGPAPSLRGGDVRLRPMLSVGIAEVGGRRREFEALQLDTGADDVLFTLRTAANLGIDLRSAQRTTMYTADGRTLSVAYAEVELTLAESAAHYVRWVATVGFAPLPRGLFGFAGGLEFFHAALDHHAARFALTPHDHLPATARVIPPAPSPVRP